MNVVPSIMSTTATLDCTLPCFSPNVQCDVSNITPNNELMISYSRVMGSSMNYNYPTQQIMISNLKYDTLYNYCVVAINTTNNMTVGDPVCRSFTTPPGISCYDFIVSMCIRIRQEFIILIIQEYPILSILRLTLNPASFLILKTWKMHINFQSKPCMVCANYRL